jgi:phosphoribosyl 1,2-cyclic phosphodiesterase
VIVVRFRGVRGSFPATGRAFQRYGGNTPCVEVVTASGRRIILDAGTGIVSLGAELAASGVAVDTDVFLTHFHWDHIQGLPFFEPLHTPGNIVRVHAPRQGAFDARMLLGSIASPAYMPVPLSALGGHIEYSDVTEDDWIADDVRVASVRVHHPSHTRGYRLDCDGVSMAYVPDHELGAGAADVRLRRLIADVDLLVHDAMFTTAEYDTRRGWGHSTHAAAVSLALDVGAGMLCLFHHAPHRSDAELDLVAAAYGAATSAAAGIPGGSASGAGAPLVVVPAEEGCTVTLQRGRRPALQRHRCGDGATPAC